MEKATLDLSSLEEPLDRINGHIYRSLGIHISKEKRYLLEARVAKIMDRGRYASVLDFAAALDSGHRDSWEALIRHTTTNHTYFFREESHFTFLADRIQERRQPRPVVWSAACSTGEEPYSIILTLLERGLKDFLVIASDVNADVLRKASLGIFPSSRISQIPPPMREKYFRPLDGNRWTVEPAVRRHLRVKRINLVEAVRFDEPVDYVFCRNLLIYFDQPGGSKIVANVTKNLRPGGFLLIGKSEVLFSLPPGLTKVEGSIYRKAVSHP